MAPNSSFLVIFLIFLLGVVEEIKSDQEEVNRLRKDIFKNYSTTIRPVVDQSTAVQVGAKMWVFHVEEVNDTQQTIKLHGVMQMSWRDEFLTWDPTRYSGIKYIMTQNHGVWTPKLILLNSADPETINYVWNLPVKIWSTGHTYASVEITVVSTCAFDLSSFPRDVQRCPVAFYLGSTMDQVTYTVLMDPELRFYWRQGGKQYIEGNKRVASNWRVIGQPTVERKYYTPSGLNDTIGDTPDYMASMIMEVWITFARRVPYFQYAIVLPAVLTSLITICAVTPMRTMYSLGMIMLNLFAQATFMDDLFLAVPTSVGVVPNIVKYYGANMILTVLAFFARILIQWSQNAQNDETETSPQEQEEAKRGGQQDPQSSSIQQTTGPKSLFSIILFAYVTPTRLYFFFITSYILVYIICAAIFL